MIAAQTSNNEVVQSNNEPANVAVEQPVQQSENASEQQTSANEQPQTNVVSDDSSPASK